MSDKLIEIAKANGATVSKTFFEGPHHVSMTEDQLRATIEQVCAPLVEALRRINLELPNFNTDSDIALANKALDDYRTINGDKE